MILTHCDIDTIFDKFIFFNILMYFFGGIHNSSPKFVTQVLYIR